LAQGRSLGCFMPSIWFTTSRLTHRKCRRSQLAYRTARSHTDVWKAHGHMRSTCTSTPVTAPSRPPHPTLDRVIGRDRTRTLTRGSRCGAEQPVGEVGQRGDVDVVGRAQ